MFVRRGTTDDKSQVSYKAHRQFTDIFNRLRAESRPVDFSESFTPIGYIENTFWQLVLNVSHTIANNKIAKPPRD